MYAIATIEPMYPTGKNAILAFCPLLTLYQTSHLTLNLRVFFDSSGQDRLGKM
jgi:hypothetical protein